MLNATTVVRIFVFSSSVDSAVKSVFCAFPTIYCFRSVVVIELTRRSARVRVDGRNEEDWFTLVRESSQGNVVGSVLVHDEVSVVLILTRSDNTKLLYSKF
jgi:hypothetical protein